MTTYRLVDLPVVPRPTAEDPEPKAGIVAVNPASVVFVAPGRGLTDGLVEVSTQTGTLLVQEPFDSVVAKINAAFDPQPQETEDDHPI